MDFLLRGKLAVSFNRKTKGARGGELARSCDLEMKAAELGELAHSVPYTTADALLTASRSLSIAHTTSAVGCLRQILKEVEVKDKRKVPDSNYKWGK